jgi:hypothetical protein
MTRVVLAIVLMLSLNGSGAARDLVMIEGAYEVALGDVALPRTAASSATFRPCPGCDVIGLPASSATRYVLNGGQLELADFLAAADALRQTNGDALVTILYDLQTNRITRITVHARA